MRLGAEGQFLLCDIVGRLHDTHTRGKVGGWEEGDLAMTNGMGCAGEHALCHWSGIGVAKIGWHGWCLPMRWHRNQQDGCQAEGGMEIAVLLDGAYYMVAGSVPMGLELRR